MRGKGAGEPPGTTVWGLFMESSNHGHRNISSRGNIGQHGRPSQQAGRSKNSNAGQGNSGPAATSHRLAAEDVGFTRSHHTLQPLAQKFNALHWGTRYVAQWVPFGPSWWAPFKLTHSRQGSLAFLLAAAGRGLFRWHGPP